MSLWLGNTPGLEDLIRQNALAEVAGGCNFDELSMSCFCLVVGRAVWQLAPVTFPAAKSILISLVISGTNDVLNSQGHTQAAWWNRIPLRRGR